MNTGNTSRRVKERGASTFLSICRYDLRARVQEVAVMDEVADLRDHLLSAEPLAATAAGGRSGHSPQSQREPLTMTRNVALKDTRLERSRVWQLMLRTHPELLDDLLDRAAGVAGAREERRLGALTPAMRVLTVAERRRLLGALRSRLAGAPSGMVVQLKVLTVPKPAPVRPDLALGFGPDAALTVLATIDGKARTLGAVNAPTARLAFGVDDPAGLPATVRANGLWYFDAQGSLVVNQTEAYRHPPAGASRHRWLPPNWTLAPDAEWLWLTPAPASYAPYAPSWQTPDLEQVAAVILACHRDFPRDELADALALHVAKRGSHDYAADWHTGRSSTAPRISRHWPAEAWRGHIRAIRHRGRVTAVAYVAGWQQLLNGRIVTDADRAGGPALAAEGAVWVAELGALTERGWGARCLRGCARVCLCTDAAGTPSTTGRQLL